MTNLLRVVVKAQLNRSRKVTDSSPLWAVPVKCLLANVV